MAINIRFCGTIVCIAGLGLAGIGCASEPTARQPRPGSTAGPVGTAGRPTGAAPGFPGFSGSSAPRPGPIPGSTGPSGGFTDTVCASALVQTAKTMPTIMFVIDGSGSMCAPFGSTTRWQALRSALLDPMRGFIYRLQSSVSFGSVLYDGTVDLDLGLAAPGGGIDNPACALFYAQQKAMGECPQLIEVLPAALNNAKAIDMTYPMTELGGSTPTDKAMKYVMDQLVAQVQVQGPDQKALSPVYVILATDGAPNDICMGGVGGDGAAQRQGVIAAVDQGAAVGITTWVVSLADGNAPLEAHLDEVARHGEPANPMARTFSPTNPDDLIQTLAQLLGGAIGCNITLNGAVTVGQECSGTVSAQGKPLPCCQQDPTTGWSCDGQPTTTPNGWRLTDPSSIELVGDACTQFLVASDATLSAMFPCEVFTPL